MMPQSPCFYRKTMIEARFSETLSYPVEAYERIGSGLGLYLVDERWTDDGYEPAGYSLLHLASGYGLLSLRVPSLVQAGRWLQLVRGLADWTQPTQALKKQRKLHRKVLLAYKAVCLPC